MSDENSSSSCCGPGYASPAHAMKAPREKLLYTIAIYVGTGIQKPDYLATIDADPESPTYSQVISRCEMPGIGDELHHMGWNACSSCFDDEGMERKYLIVPGVRSSNLHIVDCATDPRNPKVHKVISGEEIKEKTNLSAPHTVHCLGSDIIISMLGDAKGNAPGGGIYILIKISTLLAAGKTRWGTLSLAMIFGINRVITSWSHQSGQHPIRLCQDLTLKKLVI